jgi:uncharacterized metal-binding protein
MQARIRESQSAIGLMEKVQNVLCILAGLLLNGLLHSLSEFDCSKQKEPLIL